MVCPAQLGPELIASFNMAASSNSYESFCANLTHKADEIKHFQTEVDEKEAQNYLEELVLSDDEFFVGITQSDLTRSKAGVGVGLVDTNVHRPDQANMLVYNKCYTRPY